jgi:hypothetical protein
MSGFRATTGSTVSTGRMGSETVALAIALNATAATSAARRAPPAPAFEPPVDGRRPGCEQDREEAAEVVGLAARGQQDGREHDPRQVGVDVVQQPAQPVLSLASLAYEPFWAPGSELAAHDPILEE